MHFNQPDWRFPVVLCGEECLLKPFLGDAPSLGFYTKFPNYRDLWVSFSGFCSLLFPLVFVVLQTFRLCNRLLSSSLSSVALRHLTYDGSSSVLWDRQDRNKSLGQYLQKTVFHSSFSFPMEKLWLGFFLSIKSSAGLWERLDAVGMKWFFLPITMWLFWALSLPGVLQLPDFWSTQKGFLDSMLLLSWYLCEATRSRASYSGILLPSLPAYYF